MVPTGASPHPYHVGIGIPECAVSHCVTQVTKMAILCFSIRPAAPAALLSLGKFKISHFVGGFIILDCYHSLHNSLLIPELFWFVNSDLEGLNWCNEC